MKWDRVGFGERLASARRACVPRLSQAEAAIRVGKRPDALSKYERGEVIPTVDTVAALCAVYGCTIDSLLD